METIPTDNVFETFSSEPFNLSDFFNLDTDECLWLQGDALDQNANGVEAAAAPHDAPPLEQRLDYSTNNHGRPYQNDQSLVKDGTPKSGTLTESEWEWIFSIVFPRYLKKSFTEILKLIPEKSHLRPSRKQLKTKIQLWHEQARLPHKNINKTDMDYMVLVAQLRKEQGLQTAFKHHGFPVQEEKLRKHKQRWGINYLELSADNSPEHITWDTPFASSSVATGSDALPQRSSETPVNPPLPSRSFSLEITPTQSTKLELIRPVSDQHALEYFEGVSKPKEVNCTPDHHDQASSSLVLSSSQHSNRIQTRPEKRSRDETSSAEYRPQRPQVDSSRLPFDAKPPQQCKIPEPPRKFEYVTRREFSSVILLEPKTEKITFEQLAMEVKSIYAGLTMIETKCIQVGSALVSQSVETPGLPSEHWQALVALHRTLLGEHRDFFLASQHPTATPALKRLATKYSMPARMWKHGVYQFLELMRRNLPHTMDFMLSFIHGVAYPIYTTMFETVPQFEDIWTECLGDIARYRMAIEEEDQSYRKIWAETARSWYRRTADQLPCTGRLHHHLGILSRADYLRELFYLSRSMTSGTVFSAGRNTMLTTLESSPMGVPEQAKGLTELFRKTHLALFTGKFSEGRAEASKFASALNSHIHNQPNQWKAHGLYLAVVNTSALFEYGSQNSLRYMFDLANHLSSQPNSPTFEDTELPNHLKAPNLTGILEANRQAICCDLIFDTLAAILTLEDWSSSIGHVLTIMTFLVSLSEASESIRVPFPSSHIETQRILQRVPWQALCSFLNRKAFEESRLSPPSTFPMSYESYHQPLPEDYQLRGLVWTMNYFPSGWFDGHPEADFDYIECEAFVDMRSQRVVWLAWKLCTHGYMAFEDGVFSEIHVSADHCTTSSISIDLSAWDRLQSDEPIADWEGSPCQPSDATTSQRDWSISESVGNRSTSPSSLDDQLPAEKMDK